MKVAVLFSAMIALSVAAKFTVPAGVVPEGLAWWRGPDGNSPRLCVSSFTGQGVLMFDSSGNSQGSIVSGDMLSVTAGLFVSGDQLFVASDLAFPPAPNTAEQAKVNVFNLLTKSELYVPGIFTSDVARPNASLPALGNDVLVDQFGVIYATDSLLGHIYMIQDAGANQLNITLLSDSPLLAPSPATTEFSGINGCAATATSSPAETTLICSYSGPPAYARLLKVHATFKGVSVTPVQITSAPSDLLWPQLQSAVWGADGIRLDSKGLLYVTGYNSNSTWVTRFQTTDNWQTARPLQMSATSAPQVTSVAVDASNTVWALSNNHFSSNLPAVVETMSFNPSLSAVSGVYGAPGTNGYLTLCVDINNNLWGTQNGFRYLEGTASVASASSVTLTGWFVDGGELAAYADDERVINKYVLNKAKLDSFGRFSLVVDLSTGCISGRYSYGTTTKLTEAWARACPLAPGLVPCTTECLQPFSFDPSFSAASVKSAVSDGGPTGSYTLMVAGSTSSSSDPGTLSLCSDKKGVVSGSYRLPNGTSGYVSGQCYLSGRVCATNFYQSSVDSFGPLLLRVLDADHIVASALASSTLIPGPNVGGRLSPLAAQQSISDATTSLFLISRVAGTSQPSSVPGELESQCRANKKMRSKWVKTEEDGLSIAEIVAISVVALFIVILIALGAYVLIYGRPGAGAGGSGFGWPSGGGGGVGVSGAGLSASPGMAPLPAHGNTGYRGFDDSRL